MKKLLHLQLLPLLTGVQNFSLHLLDGLPQGEYDIHVASKPGGALVEAVRTRGYKYIPIHSLQHSISPLDLLAFLQLLLVMKRKHFDIVHTNSSKTGLLGRLAASLCRVPLIVHTEHGTAFHQNQNPLQRRLFQAMEWLGNRLCHRVVFVNNSDRDMCLKLRLLQPEKASTIYNAIPESFGQALNEIGRNRSYDKLKQDFVVGSTLRFSAQKNVVDTVSAACHACKAQKRLRFIFVGEGKYLDLCRQIVRSHGLNERILLPGWDSNITEWLKVFDAFILYSRWEAQPFSAIEAMHAGLAIIGSSIASLDELVDDQCGFLIGLDDLKSLSECLVSLPDRSLEMFEKGQHAMRRIAELCNYKDMVDGYLAIYRRGNDPATGMNI